MVSWGDERSFEFCFDSVVKGSPVAVCTYYWENDEKAFMPGYNMMLKVIEPRAVLCYDEPFKAMGTVKYFSQIYSMQYFILSRFFYLHISV